MDPNQLFADERYSMYCVFCGNVPTTREHAASKTLLDDPLPDNLPIVGSCHECNNGFSSDEQYLACLLDCIISGSTDADKMQWTKTAATLRRSPALPLESRRSSRLTATAD